MKKSVMPNRIFFLAIIAKMCLKEYCPLRNTNIKSMELIPQSQEDLFVLFVQNHTRKKSTWTTIKSFVLDQVQMFWYPQEKIVMSKLKIFQGHKSKSGKKENMLALTVLSPTGINTTLTITRRCVLGQIKLYQRSQTKLWLMKLSNMQGRIPSSKQPEDTKFRKSPLRVGYNGLVPRVAPSARGHFIQKVLF